MAGKSCVLAACALALGIAATGCVPRQTKVMRYGSVIGIKPENIEEYKKFHAAVWPQVLAKLQEVNVRNYSIYLAEVEKGEWYLFSYFEYTGDDFKADMKRMGDDPNTQRWWKHTDPLQVAVETRQEGEWWHGIEEVFHMD